MKPVIIALDIWTDLFGAAVDWDAVMWGFFVVIALIVGIIVGLWSLTRNFFIGMFILVITFVAAAVYFGMVG